LGIDPEDDKLEDWRYNLESKPYRLFSNKAHATLRNCNFQIALLGVIKKESENLLNILKKDEKNK
jgi:hypothetical protein